MYLVIKYWTDLNFDLLVALEEKVGGSPKLLQFILRGTRMSLQNFMTIHPVVVEIFQSGPKWHHRWSPSDVPVSVLMSQHLKRSLDLQVLPFKEIVLHNDQ